MTKVTYAVSVATPGIVVGVLFYKVGWVDSQMNKIVFTQLAPFIISVLLAWLVKRDPVLSVIVFLGTATAAAYAFMGLYLGFWHEPARGAWNVVYRPFWELVVMGITGTLVLTGVIWRKRPPAGR